MGLTRRNHSENEKEEKVMKHSKRYMVIFNKWNPCVFHEDKSEYDTIEEVNEEVKLLEELYRDTPRPECKYKYKLWNRNDIDSYIWCQGDYFWGYLILDFEKEKIVKWGNDQLKYVNNQEKDIRKIKDRYFRKEGEVPKDYKWDFGEYDGWLQYRWGNGKNSIEYGENAVIDNIETSKRQCIRHCKIKKKKYRNFTYNESEEKALDMLNKELMEEEVKVETS